jgi:uncharacterized membrane protein
MIVDIIKIMLIMGLIDSIYLLSISNSFKKYITNKELNYFAMFICYIFLTAGLYYFIIKEKKNYIDAFILGLIIYGVYEFTNKTILENWGWDIVIIDTLWGGILFGLTTFIFQHIQ